MPQAVAAVGTWWAGLGATAKFFITLAATFAISAVTTKLFGPKAPRSSFQGTQTTGRSALEYRRHGYGRGKMGGAIFWNNTRGTTNEWLDYHIAYCDHFAELEGVYLDDDFIPVANIDWAPATVDGNAGSGTGNVLEAKYQGTGPTYGLRIQWQPGWPNQPANALITAAYTELDANHRARGVFNIVYSLQYKQETEKVWQSGAPRNMLALLKLRRIYQRRRYSLNMDPTFETALLSVSTNRTKWFGNVTQSIDIDSDWSYASPTLSITENTAANNSLHSERFPVDTAKRYLVRCTARQTQGDRRNYIGVVFYDSNGDPIHNSSTPVSDATGWNIGLPGHYLPTAANIVFPATFTDYTLDFGAGASATIPSNAVQMSLYGSFSRDGAVGTLTTVDLQDYSVYEWDGVNTRHDVNDETTWEWSENPADCMADYLVQFMDANPDEEIDWQSVVDASLACDVQVAIPTASTQKRYTCNGVWLTSVEHEKNLEDLKNCFNAKLVYTGGKWVMWAGVWQAPQISWDHTALADGDVTVQGSAEPDNRFNIVKGFYVDQDRDYIPVEFVAQTNAAYTTRDNGQELEFDIDYKFVNDEYQAQRCAKHKLDQFDNMKVMTAVMNEQGARAYPGLMVDWTLDEFGFTNKAFRCIEWRPREDGNFLVTFQEDFQTRYDDLLEGEYTTKGAHGVVTVGVPVVPSPTNLAATGKEGAIELTFDPGPKSLYDVTEIWTSNATNDRSLAILVAEVTSNNFLHVVGDTQIYYYWVRNRFGPDDYSAWEPVSATAGVSGQATSAAQVFYQYIRPTNGTAIRNGAGTLTLEARQVSGAVDSLLSSGTIRLYVGSTEVTVANGYAAGSDGFTGVFDSGDINGDVVVELKDGPAGTVIDSETLVDISDGAAGGDAVYGFIESDNGLAWTRAPNAGAWTPSQATIDLDATFVQAGGDVARIARRITLNTSNGTLTSSVIAHGGGDLNTGRVTVTVTGSASTAITVEYAYSFGGESATISQTVFSSQGGIDGDDGLSVHVANVYLRSASAPATPTGGQYDFGTQVLTPPTGWFVEPPAGQDPLWVSTGSFSVVGQSGVDTTTTWSAPSLFAQDGNTGLIVSSKDWDPLTTDFNGMGAWDRYSGAAANMSMLTDEDGPFGEYPLVMQVNGTATPSAPGWFGGLQADFGFDIYRSYVFYTWVKRLSAATTRGLYCGFTTTAAANEVVDNAGTDTGNTNPYYVSNVATELTVGKWYLAVGVIWARDSVPGQQAIAGIYDPDDGQRIYSGSEFEWAGDQLDPSFVWRIAFYSNTTTMGTADGFQYTRPTCWVRDGTEPSVEAVLGAGAISGNFRDVKFQRSSTAPATPTGNNPAGWFDSIPNGVDAIWQTVGTKRANGTLIGVWSTPQRIQSLVYRGDYQAATAYLPDDVVSYSERTYICTVATTGNAPSGTNAGNTWWDLLAGKGDPGDPPSTFTDTIAITSLPANLRDLANTAGYDGISNATVTFNLGSGVTGNGVGGAAAVAGGRGIDTGTWPSGVATINLTLNVNGTVRGGGGGGGDGGNGLANQNGENGGNGGDAIYCQEDITIVVSSTGSVLGGGGGGGGGAGSTNGPTEPLDYGGGGGGGGYPNGAGGLAGSGILVSNDGAAGTTSGGGLGGNAAGTGGDGGDGGGIAAAGTLGGSGTGSETNGTRGTGGAAGFAIRYNGNTVGLTNNGGTITGSTG